MTKTWKPTTAGILSIISGALGIIWGFIVMHRASEIERIGRHLVRDTFGGILIIVGILAIVGGVYAILRKTWGMAMTGAVCAIFSPGAILGILATIFVSMSKNEF